MDQTSAIALAQSYLDNLPRHPVMGRLLVQATEVYQRPEGWFCPLQSARFLICGRRHYAAPLGAAILVDGDGGCWRVRVKALGRVN